MSRWLMPLSHHGKSVNHRIGPGGHLKIPHLWPGVFRMPGAASCCSSMEFPGKEKPPDEPVSSEGFKGTQSFKRRLFIFPVESLNLVSSQPGFLIEPTDGQEKGQEEHPEHEVGRRPEILINLESQIQEEEGCKGNHESPAADDHDVLILLIYGPLCVLQCCHDLFLLSSFYRSLFQMNLLSVNQPGF